MGPSKVIRKRGDPYNVSTNLLTSRALSRVQPAWQRTAMAKVSHRKHTHHNSFGGRNGNPGVFDDSMIPRFCL